jgi:hypothetical protein
LPACEILRPHGESRRLSGQFQGQDLRDLSAHVGRDRKRLRLVLEVRGPGSPAWL